jgi:hypothetical protein
MDLPALSIGVAAPLVVVAGRMVGTKARLELWVDIQNLLEFVQAIVIAIQTLLLSYQQEKVERLAQLFHHTCYKKQHHLEAYPHNNDKISPSHLPCYRAFTLVTKTIEQIRNLRPSITEVYYENKWEFD